MGEHMGLRVAANRYPHNRGRANGPRKHPTCLVLHVPKEEATHWRFYETCIWIYLGDRLLWGISLRVPARGVVRMDHGRQDAPDAAGERFADQCSLLGAFAIQHSGMARQSFKRAWTKVVPPLLERSTYVLMASLILLAVVEFWQPLPGTIWSVHNSAAVLVLQALFWFGWALLFTCTLLIDHFDLFGLKQSWKYLRDEEYEPPRFRTPGPVSSGAPSAVPGIRDCVLERAAHDERAAVLCRHVHRLHPDRDPVGRARPDDHSW